MSFEIGILQIEKTQFYKKGSFRQAKAMVTTMKRIVFLMTAALLAVGMLVSAVSCNSADKDPVTTDALTTKAPLKDDEPSATETPDATEKPSGTDAPAVTDEPAETDESVGTDAPAETDGSTEETQPDRDTESPAESQTQPLPETEEILENLAPDFTMLDKDGNQVKLSDLVGKPIVLNFWASWCPPCKAEMPDFEQAYQKYGDDVVFVMLNLTDGYSETIATAKAHIAAYGYTFPVYFDTMGEGGYFYEVSAIPQTCFINDRGQLVSTMVGMLDGETLEAWIVRLLAN